METSVLIPPSEADTASTFDAESFWKQFHHRTAKVDGVRLHYVEGGSGAPVLLLPGWPQSWYAWRRVMPLLAASGRRVIALDPRGLGDSDRPASGYDLKTVAAEVHGFVEALGLAAGGRLDVVGHDIGAWIAHAYAADWPGDLRRLALLDAVLVGITPPPPAGIPSAEANVKAWHFAFNRLDDLPELLIQGREREFLAWMFHHKAFRRGVISPADLEEYVRVNAAPGALRAAFSYYRAAASPEGLAQSRARMERRLTMPVLALGGDMAVGDGLASTLRQIATDVRGRVLQECGHYLPEECPHTVAQELIRFYEAAPG
jgi:pimeloyl-ACP methyl ester carboxylesterase